MKKNEFSLVFQYDEDQAGGRSPERQVKRIVESKGGSFIDAFESYGMVDVTCSFAGTPEEVQKIGNEILTLQQQRNVKMSQHIYQKFYVFNVIGGYENEDLVRECRDIVRSIPMARVGQDEYKKENLNIRIPTKIDYDSVVEALTQKTKSLLPDAEIYHDQENKILFENNNYSENKKKLSI